MLDNKLIFSKYISITFSRVNSVIFTIKKLFYLPLTTKIQFFKSFILPLFDYCLTLSIYYEKYIIQKLSNCYYLTMLILFDPTKSNNFYFNDMTHDGIHSFLANYKLSSFCHRVFIRLDVFLFKIIKSKTQSLLNHKLRVNQMMNWLIV